MIIFENKGELDVRAIRTFGVNSKNDPHSAIGYFGTGLKYAIAILLRTGHDIKIYTGGKRYDFSVVRSKIRHNEFDIVAMNGDELGFTTELGKTWELWQAFRELQSNVLDEGGDSCLAEELPKIESDATYVVVTGEKFESVWHDKDKYFLNSNVRTLHSSDGVRIVEKPKYRSHAAIFYHGVRVASSEPSEGQYDYAFHSHLTLTEDRTVKDSWGLQWALARSLIGCKDRKLLKKLLLSPKGTFEFDIRYNFHPDSASEEFIEVVEELRMKYKDTQINPYALDAHRKLRPEVKVLPIKSCSMNNIEMRQLEKAVKFCRDVLELKIDEYELIVCEDLGSDNDLGRADIDDGIMYISRQCFREGTKRVAVAILEEYTHCHHQVYDETVEQKWVYLNQILSLGERLHGEPL